VPPRPASAFGAALLAAALFAATSPAAAQPRVADGAAITPDFAQKLYEQVSVLQESDGCRLVRFDTSRFRITIGLQAPSGAVHAFELAATARGGTGRRAGDWALAVPAEVERDCGATLAAIERVLGETAGPQGRWLGTNGVAIASLNYRLVAASFVLLLLWTARILYRETKARRPPAYAILSLVIVSGAALVLRLLLAPRTFLHEYYHIAETVPGYLTGDIGPLYGKTGPSLFRLTAAALGRGEDVQVIFLTNAVISSLAVPAVALLDLAFMRSWPRALCAAVLLCVLPLHLRFSAAEDLFVQAATFGMWALGLFVLYLRTRRLEDVLATALALSLAMQTRPEMLLFPGVLVALVLLAELRSWRVLFAWRTLLALLFLGVLIVPRLFELQSVLGDPRSPAPVLPDASRYLSRLILFDGNVTPAAYWLLLGLGLAWGLSRKPGFHLWVIAVFLGYTLVSLSLFDNPPYNLRSQLLPTTLLMLVAAGSASLWMELWGRRGRMALGVGACALVGLSAGVVVTSRHFVTELRDQQLEWAFLERTVPRLPQRATLLTAVDMGGRNLDAFPEFLLRRADKQYEMVDVRRAAEGKTAWPTAGENLLYYQGMFCYFAFDDEPPPDPMTATCRSVHERYLAEPLFVEDLDTEGYSFLRYAKGPFRIGFFRLKARR
jgi:hypothetical protein